VQHSARGRFVSMSDPQPLWQPTEAQIQRSQMYAFMTAAAAKYGFEPDWFALHRWSIEHRDQFWQEMLTFAGIEPMTPAGTVIEGEGMVATTRWFPGMELNYAAHLLRFRDERIALTSEDERGRPRSITYAELYRLVAGYAGALKAMGVGRGDRVGAFMPNVPETVIGMLAATSLGAIWSSCSPDFGINGVFDRFGQIEPKVLIACDGYTYNHKAIDCRDRVKGIVERLPSLEHVIVVPFLSEQPDISDIPKAHHWTEVPTNDTEVEFTPVPFDHPLYIMYSSGTTGVPKCIVHGHGGTLLQHMKELMLHTDLRREDTIFYFTTCGWMMWNWLVSSLGVGATVVLFEGNPGTPSMSRLWELADRTKMTVFGTSAKYITACEKAGINPIEEQNLEHLRAVLSTGSPLTVENFRWVYSHIKKDLLLGSICGGTDIISCFFLGNPIRPVYEGECQSLGLGMDVQALGANGQPVLGEKGELVCARPFPSQPVGFWNDPNHDKYRAAYFDHYPGIWRHGDYVEITPHGGVVVYGRSDATLNPGGVRIGTAEIYRQVEAMEEIVDSVVVGKETDDADVEICLFIVLRDGLTLDVDLLKKIRARISDGATKRHVPKHIKQVTAVPYTISGKKVELAVTQMIHGREVKNRDALKNPEALDQYAGIV
jgi:acetoacetyl-CoA synthetase